MWRNWDTVLKKPKKKKTKQTLSYGSGEKFQRALEKISAFTSKNQPIGSTNVANKIKDAVLNWCSALTNVAHILK